MEKEILKAEFSIDTPVSNLVSQLKSDNKPTDLDVVEPTEEDIEEQVEMLGGYPKAPNPDDLPDNSVEPEESRQAESYSDYSPWALLALEQKESGNIPANIDIDRNLSGEDFKELFLGELSREFEGVMKEKGEVYRLAQYLLQGGSPQVAQQVISREDFSNVPLDVKENQKNVIRAYYSDFKGLDEDEISTIIENFDLDGKLREKSEKFQEIYRANKAHEYERMLKEQEQYQALQQKKAEESKNKMRKTIEKGNIKGIHVPKNKRAQFLRDIFEPTELVQVPDESGKQQTVKVTRLEKMNMELSQDMEAQLVYAWMVLNNFNVEDIKEQGKIEQNNSILDMYQAKSTNTSMENMLDDVGKKWKDKF